MNTQQKVGLYQDALLKWLAAKRDHPGLFHPEPNAADYKLEPWLAQVTKDKMEREFNRRA